MKDQLLTHVDEVKRKTAFCRDWRNRRFAHHDLLLATSHAQAKPLEAATKEKFAEALRAISDLLNVMERFYHRGVCDFGAIAAHNGAATLLFILGFGVQGRERMQEKLAKGDFTAATDAPERI